MQKIGFFIFSIFFFANQSLCQNEGYIQFNGSDVMHFIVTDPQNRRTGRDTKGAANSYIGNPINEIPGANYAFGGINDFPEDHEFLYNPISPNADGEYSLTIIGIKLGKFQIGGWIDPPHGRPSGHITVNGVIDKDCILIFHFNYSDTTTTPPRLKKYIATQSLIQDVSAMSKLGWINTQTVRDKYTSLFENYRLQLEVRDYAAARTTLNNTLVELKQDSNISITADAQKLLTADIQQLLSEPPLLLSPQAATDTLMAQLSYAYSLAWIGDKNFVNELQNGLNNARKHLSKSDFTNCSKEIRTFQDKLKKEYDKKSTAKDKRFVSTEGYPYLYNNAQYIVDRIK
jgi:hypothetical protein